MLNYKVLQLDLNQLSDEELECYLILKKAMKRIGVMVGNDDEQFVPEGDDDNLPEYKQ